MVNGYHIIRLFYSTNLAFYFSVNGYFCYFTEIYTTIQPQKSYQIFFNYE